MKIKTVKKNAAKKVVTKKATTCAAKKCAAKKTCTKASAKSVTFTIHAEKDKNVYLAGTFNEWDPTGKKMSFKDGVYSATIKLAPGEYQYKFVVDGTWCADPANVNAVPNAHGTYNSVIIVK